MPVYNGERYLGEAVESILCQSFSDFELLIINDGSTDASTSIAGSYNDDRIRFITNENNLGIVETLNRGIDLAQGEYIARMDADDISLPRRLEIQVGFMDAHPGAGISGTNVRTFGTADATIWIYPPDHKTILSSLIFSPPLAHPAVIMRRKIIIDNNLRYSKLFPHAEDYAFWIQCAEYTTFANIQRTLLSYRLHPTKVGVTYKEIQEDSINRARESLLSSLHVNASPEERLLHNSLGNWTFGKSTQYALDAEQWLLKLKEANRTTKTFPEPEFSFVLFEKWFSVCYQLQTMGRGRWRIFLRSPLFRLCNTNVQGMRHFLFKHLFLIFDMYKGKAVSAL